jgi:NADH-quinone oxidoreductase subunit H
MRAVAQLISYEVPVVLSIVGVLIFTGSLSLVRIVEAQEIPFLLLQPLAFFIFAAGSSAEMNRTPFDQVEAESEITAGYHTEYSGMKFGVFQLAEFGAVLSTSGIMATLFLKGWEGPFLPSHLWFLLKVFFFAFCFIWVRSTLPRLRIDQIMAFAWKFLLPLSIINIFVIATEVLVFGDEVVVDGVTQRIFTTANLWTMAGINLVVALAGIGIFSRIVRLGGGSAPKTGARHLAGDVA